MSDTVTTSTRRADGSAQGDKPAISGAKVTCSTALVIEDEGRPGRGQRALETTWSQPTLNDMTQHRTVRDVMITEVISVHRNTAFKDIAALFAVHRISAVPVLDDKRRVLGVVTETDLLSKESTPERHGVRPPAFGRRRTLRAKAGATRAHELMTAPAITVDADADFATAAQQLERQHVKHLPVVDRDGTLLGIVARSDLLRVFLRPDVDIAAEINDEILAGVKEARADVIDGVVVLRGRVSNRTVLSEAVAGAREVDGVVAVIEHLTCADDERDVRPARR